MQPRIFLAIDNCFASKRWTQPEKWMEVIKDLGVYYVEASADNECDPIYMEQEYLNDWKNEIKKYSEKYGIKVVNLYSGHGTYTTLGLTHTDVRVRDRFQNDWLKPMISTAGKLGAGLGFFCHAFADSILQNNNEYIFMENDFYNRLSELARYTAENGYGPIGVEQMYTPHQIPWTIEGTEKLLVQIHKRSKSDFYITIDLGHQTGQRKFLRPGHGKIKMALRRYKTERKCDGLWLGSQSTYKAFKCAALKPDIYEDSEIEKIEKEMGKYPYMFACYQDGDPYMWLERLACYSPIIHLQQNNGKNSSHLPFIEKYNREGIISGEKVLKAIAVSYDRKKIEGAPSRSKNIYLTLEMFTETAAFNNDTLENLQETVKYWRQFISKDGLLLNEL